jgi:hypothetical protein
VPHFGFWPSLARGTRLSAESVGQAMISVSAVAVVSDISISFARRAEARL